MPGGEPDDEGEDGDDEGGEGEEEEDGEEDPILEAGLGSYRKKGIKKPSADYSPYTSLYFLQSFPCRSLQLQGMTWLPLQLPLALLNLKNQCQW